MVNLVNTHNGELKHMPGHGVQQGQATGLDPKIQIVGKIYRCCEIFILFYF